MKLLPVYILAFILLPWNTNAQKDDYARSPVWIRMMDDTTANYFEVQKAYNVYWQHHEKPAGEDDEVSSAAYLGAHSRTSRREQRRIDANNTMLLAIKKFEQWKMDMKPYVHTDGTMLTPAERLKLLQQLKAGNNNSK